jgi:hypothetical protein
MVPLENASIRKILALFVSTLYLRNPQRMREHQLIHQRITELLGANQLADPNAPAPRRSRPSDFQVPFASDILANARPLAETLLERRWAIVASDAPEFATCDAPVIVHGTGGAPFSLGVVGTTVHLPLSPTRFLIIEDSRAPSGYYASQPGFADEANYNTWIAADRYLLSWHPSHAVLARIMALADERGLS